MLPVLVNQAGAPTTRMVTVKVMKGTEATPVKVDPSKYGFLSIQLQDEAYAQEFVNTDKVIADLSAAALGPEFAADIATTLDVADGRVAVTDVRLAAQTLRGADYLQLREELYLEQVVAVLKHAAEEDSDVPPSSGNKEVVACVHTGQLMWDHLGAYTVLRLEQKGIISLGYKGTIHARDKRIDDKLLALANVLNDVTSLDMSENTKITTCEPFADTLLELKADWSGITDEGLKLCTNLRKLDVSGDVRGVTTCAPFANTLEELAALSIYSRITDVSLQRCRKLRKLSIRENEDVATCAPFANTLEELDAGGAHCGISDASLECCRKIRKLTVNDNAKVTTCTPFADTLEELDAEGDNCGIRDASLLCCRNIRKLSVNFNPNVTTCVPFAATLEELEAGCESGLASDAIQDCTTLKKLGVPGNPKMTTCDSCKDLEELTPSSSFTAASLQKVAEHCTRLKHLDLSCPALRRGVVTDALIITFAESCHQLQYLDLSGAVTLTDSSIIPLVEKCRQLRSLMVSGCTAITDAAIIKVAEKCPELRHLEVRGSRAMTDITIIKVAENCPLLESLTVAFTFNITDVSIKKVAEFCPRLQFLDVSHTDGRISNESIVEIAKNCTSLVHLDARNTKGTVGGDALKLLLPSFKDHVMRGRYVTMKNLLPTSSASFL